MVGEPIHVTYTLVNNSEVGMQFSEGGNQRNRLGRFDDYALRVIRSDGEVLEAVDSEPNFGGLSWSPTIARRESFVHELFLPNWAALTDLGTYTIVSERTFLTRQAASNQWHGEGGEEITLMATAEVTVIPANDETFGRIISDLGREMFSESAGEARMNAWQMMGVISDPRVLPHYRNAVASRKYGWVSSALTALATRTDDEALACIKMAMHLKGPDLVGEFARPELAESSANNLRQHAAQTLSSSPHPGAFPQLLTMSDDASPSVRLTVLHAIANKRPGDAQKRIRAFMSDSSAMVRGEAKRYLATF